MQRLFSAFPGGWPGVGLVLLRGILAFGGFAQGYCLFTRLDGPGWMAWFIGLFGILVGLLLLMGLFTPIAGVLAGLGSVVQSVSLIYSAYPHKPSETIASLNLSAVSVALVLLGPGAFSVDARVFGHREIIIADGGRSSR